MNRINAICHSNGIIPVTRLIQGTNTILPSQNARTNSSRNMHCRRSALPPTGLSVSKLVRVVCPSPQPQDPAAQPFSAPGIIHNRSALFLRRAYDRVVNTHQLLSCVSGDTMSLEDLSLQECNVVVFFQKELYDLQQ